MYAVKQIRAGRRVGSKLNVRDVMSEYAQQAKRIRVERLNHQIAGEDPWGEILVEDRKAGPAEIAATRIDVTHWLNTLADKQRQVARALAMGETTSNVARAIGVTAGRVSQIRQELSISWDTFQGLL